MGTSYVLLFYFILKKKSIICEQKWRGRYQYTVGNICDRARNHPTLLGACSHIWELNAPTRTHVHTSLAWLVIVVEFASVGVAYEVQRVLAFDVLVAGFAGIVGVGSDDHQTCFLQ